jgi:asparagine synthase (glutamine-hydrolysing)
MCGIAGIIHSDSSHPVLPESIQKMCDTIAHRGPDDFGHYVAGNVGIGMRRLSIIDLATGRQPITNEDGTIWVVFNGEIYNYRELRTELEPKGHKFRTTTDTEVLVHLFEELGENCVHRLRGMFAFAIWDARKRTLTLARDRLGIKPLYYCQDAEKLAFASEIKSLLAVEGFDRRIKLKALSEFFTFGYVPGPVTIYEDIYEIPPAHIGVWYDGNFHSKRYWDIKFDPDVNKPIDFFVEGLLHHLKEAIGIHLMSEVPLGAFLSGGIDSSAIVALMAQASERKVKTFTAGFTAEQPGFDERPFARMVAESFGTDHTESLLNPQIEEILPAIIRAFDEPFADSSTVPNYLICQAARKEVTVALSGLGGDELFAGYERYRGALLADYYRRVPRVLRHRFIDRIIDARPKFRNDGVWSDRFKRFMQGTDLDLAERYQRYIAAYDDVEKTELFSGDLIHELDKRGLNSTPLAMKETANGYNSLDRMLFTDMHTYLPDDELRKMDRLSMWHSLEVRVPFLDHKFVEFVAKIPSGYKLKRWQKKHILIRALDGMLPKAILDRRKQGFSIPLNSWLRGPLRDLVHTYLAEPALREVGLFNSQAVARILNEHNRGLRNHETKIWVLLIFMLWHNLYMGNGSTPKNGLLAGTSK